MVRAAGSESSSMRMFAIVALALGGLALAFTPWTERLDNVLLDVEWSRRATTVAARATTP